MKRAAAAATGQEKVLTQQETDTTNETILVNERGAAKEWQCSPKTIYNERKAGRLPFVKIGRNCIRYRLATLKAIAAQREQTMGAQEL